VRDPSRDLRLRFLFVQGIIGAHAVRTGVIGIRTGVIGIRAGVIGDTALLSCGCFQFVDMVGGFVIVIAINQDCTSMTSCAPDATMA
jgi:hypothetical protein